MGSAPKATARPGTSSNHIKQFHMRAAEYYRSLLTGLDRVADLVGGRLSPSPPSTDCTQPVHLTAAFTSSQIYQLDPPLTPLPLPPSRDQEPVVDPSAPAFHRRRLRSTAFGIAVQINWAAATRKRRFELFVKRKRKKCLALHISSS